MADSSCRCATRPRPRRARRSARPCRRARSRRRRRRDSLRATGGRAPAPAADRGRRSGARRRAGRRRSSSGRGKAARHGDSRHARSGEIRVVQARQIDAGNLRADRRCDRLDRQRHDMISGVWDEISKSAALRDAVLLDGAKKAKRHSRVIVVLHLSCPRAEARSTAMKNVISRIFAAGVLVLACAARQAPKPIRCASRASSGSATCSST